MKHQISKFTEFLKTPFPYLFLALCLFLATTLLGNIGFRNALKGDLAEPGSTAHYAICLVCSGPGVDDVLSDIGFTVANFVLFPVTLGATALSSVFGMLSRLDDTFVYASYLFLSMVYGIVLPFLIFTAYEAFDLRLSARSNNNSVYNG